MKIRNIENIIFEITLGSIQIIRGTFLILFRCFLDFNLAVLSLFCFCTIVEDISTTFIKKKFNAIELFQFNLRFVCLSCCCWKIALRVQRPKAKRVRARKSEESSSQSRSSPTMEKKDQEKVTGYKLLPKCKINIFWILSNIFLIECKPFNVITS
jgi:hypothetical protein